MFNFKKNLLTIFLLIAMLFAAGLVQPRTSQAIGLCSTVADPSIQLTILGQTFTGDGSITVSPGSVLNFHVDTYAEPSTPNSISYPGGSYSYPGPSGYMGSGRDYTTTAINSATSINVWIGPNNCQADPNPGNEASLTLNINLTAPACAIQSFTCDGNATLAWSTSNCSSISVSPTVGSVPATGSTQGQVGTSYTLTADGNTSFTSCPAPALNSSWQEGGSSISKTVTPGSSITVPLNFSNTGQSGSVINNVSCDVTSASGISISDVTISQDCLPKTIIAP